LPSETSKQTLSADKILTFEALTFDCGVRLQDPNLRAVRHAHAKAVGRWLTTLLPLSLVQRAGAYQVFDETAESNASCLLRWRRQSIAPSADRLVLFLVGHGNGFAMLLQFCCPEMLDY